MITGLCLIPSPHALSIPCRDHVSGFLDPGIWQALSRCCTVVPRSPRETGAIAETPIAAMGAAPPARDLPRHYCPRPVLSLGCDTPFKRRELSRTVAKCRKI